MTDTVAGFPFWTLTFDEEGGPVDPDGLVQFRSEVKRLNLSDLFVFSHGWNNDQQTARRLYENFFGEISKILSERDPISRVRIGTAGVFWPSIMWPDDSLDDAGGAASISEPPGDLGSEMKKVFKEGAQQAAIDRLMIALQSEPQTYATVDAVVGDLKRLLSDQPSMPESHDLERRAAAANSGQWKQILDGLAETMPAENSEGGAAGLADALGRLWRGAKAALRVVTYWQMKARGGVVGKNGLAPLMNQLCVDFPTLRLHLLGHSFGARLVSFTLPALDTGNSPSAVKSLFLIQGAFSHFAFADSLPFDPTRKGDLAGMSDRVDGPLLTTFSAFDKAVGYAYPVASVLANDDAAAADDLMYRWEGMGFDGAQGVNAAISPLGEPGCAYALPKSLWLNLDGNAVIKRGGLPAGAHSDIIHPQIAWAALKAAGLY